jgi:hypothetical protein
VAASGQNRTGRSIYWSLPSKLDSSSADDLKEMLAPEKGRIDQCVSVRGECRILPNLTEGNEREAQLVIELRNDLPPAGDSSPSDLRSLRLTAGLLRLANHRFMTGSQLLLGRMQALVVQVPQPIQRRLVAHAWAMYGSCVSIPHLTAKSSAARLDANLRSAALSQ